MADDLQLARRAVRAGAEVAMRYFAALAELRHERKADGSVVTEADRAVEAAIRDVLTAARPGDAVLGEEGGEEGGEIGGEDGAGGGLGRRRWIIDPIDGTALFVAGDNRWLVLLALEVDGEVVAGVAAMPAQARTFWATRGGYAWESDAGGQERRITVAAVRSGDLAESRLAVLPTVEDPVTGANVIPKDPEVVSPLLAITPARAWTIHPPLAVARGDLDLAVQTGGQIWDFAATSLIVTEAGGVYRASDGGRRPRSGWSVFARDQQIAEQALRAVAADRARR